MSHNNDDSRIKRQKVLIKQSFKDVGRVRQTIQSVTSLKGTLTLLSRTTVCYRAYVVWKSVGKGYGSISIFTFPFIQRGKSKGYPSMVTHLLRWLKLDYITWNQVSFYHQEFFTRCHLKISMLLSSILSQGL
jgi:hypothetical protein